MPMLDAPVGNESRGNNVTKAQQIGIRLAISTTVAAAVGVTICFVGWRGIGSMPNCRLEQRNTRFELEQMNWQLAEYQRVMKTLPKSQGEFSSYLGSHYNSSLDENHMPLDGWGRPLVYFIKEGKAIVISYGRDGKPGGVGSDCDMSTTDLWPEEARPSFAEFVVNPLARRVLLNCLVSGVLGVYAQHGAHQERRSAWQGHDVSVLEDRRHDCWHAGHGFPYERL
jgi:hypothetical protein